MNSNDILDYYNLIKPLKMEKQNLRKIKLNLGKTS